MSIYYKVKILKHMKINKNIVVILPGRFNPLHVGHLKAYDHLCKKYGKQNVWFTSSNRQTETSPLSFKQKHKIATEFFGIPQNRFVQCKIPYVPQELIAKFKNQDFALILALGDKDSDRLKDSLAYEPLPKDLSKLKNHTKVTYVDTTPMFANGRTATSIRNRFQSQMTDKDKKALFINTFGIFDQEIFNTLTATKQ